MYRTPNGEGGCGTDNKESKRHICIQKRPYGQIHGVLTMELDRNPYARRSKHSKMKIGRHQHGIKGMLHLTFLPNPNPNIDMSWARPGLDGLTRGIDLTQ